MPDSPTLGDDARKHLQEMVKAQRTGRYEAGMGFARQKGPVVILQELEGGGEPRICEGITGEQLRAIEGAGLMSINTPRSYWRLRLRPAAFEAADAG